MATHPDAHPDSPPPAQSDDVEQVTPGEDSGRESVEDSAGEWQGTAGTGGENRVQDEGFER